MNRECSGCDVLDVTLQRGEENDKFTLVSKEINARNTFWNINKLAIGCSETTFSKNSYYTETSQMICNAKQLAGCKTVLIFSERYIQTDMNPFPANISFMDKPGSWFLLAKCVKKHLWKSYILTKDASD